MFSLTNWCNFLCWLWSRKSWKKSHQSKVYRGLIGLDSISIQKVKPCQKASSIRGWGTRTQEWTQKMTRGTKRLKQSFIIYRDMDWKDGDVEGVSGREATGNRGRGRLIPKGVRLIGGESWVWERELRGRWSRECPAKWRGEVSSRSQPLSLFSISTYSDRPTTVSRVFQ